MPFPDLFVKQVINSHKQQITVLSNIRTSASYLTWLWQPLSTNLQHETQRLWKKTGEIQSLLKTSSDITRGSSEY